MSELPMAEEPAERCGTCRYWHQTDVHLAGGEIDGECRRMPPTLPPTDAHVREASAVTGGCGLFYGWFPEVARFAWCGEWRAKDDAPA